MPDPIKMRTMNADGFISGDRPLNGYTYEQIWELNGAFVTASGLLYYFIWDSDSTEEQDLVNRPYKVRPATYVDHGVWIEQLTGIPSMFGMLFDIEGIQINPATEDKQDDIIEGIDLLAKDTNLVKLIGLVIPEHDERVFAYDVDGKMESITYKKEGSIVATKTFTRVAGKLTKVVVS